MTRFWQETDKFLTCSSIWSLTYEYRIAKRRVKCIVMLEPHFARSKTWLDPHFDVYWYFYVNYQARINWVLSSWTYTEKNLSLNSCQKLVRLTSFALSRWRWQNRRVLTRQWQVISHNLVTFLSKTRQNMHDKGDLSNEPTRQQFVIELAYRVYSPNNLHNYATRLT